ncbi:MAG TPA: SURF1 family protein [Marmoricola sp.]|nr:SURF1 family protein [Marmoricola sp.]
MLALLVRPRFWPGHLAMVVCVAVAAGLGLWQYDAWHDHRADAARDLESKPAKPLSAVMTGDSAFPGRSSGQPVSFSGSWLGADTVFVSDRERAGHKGFWVVTPVLVDGTRSAMPVVRGWSTGATAPDVSGSVAVTGWLQPSEADDSVDTDPQDDVVPSMRVASLVEHVDEDLYSGFVIARIPAAQGGIEPVRPAKVPGVSGFTGLRNLLYGIEWWVFAGFAVFIWVRWCRDSLAMSLAEDDTLETSEV